MSNPVLCTVGNLSKTALDQTKICTMANSAQDRLQYAIKFPKPDVVIAFVDTPLSELFEFQYNVVTVPMYHAEGICQYARIAMDEFALLGSFLGAVQLRALAQNPNLRPEDFDHNAAPNCLFSRGRGKDDVALIVEGLSVCNSCYEFYRCLGLEAETAALKQVVDFIEYQRIDRSLDRRQKQ